MWLNALLFLSFHHFHNWKKELSIATENKTRDSEIKTFQAGFIDFAKNDITEKDQPF